MISVRDCLSGRACGGILKPCPGNVQNSIYLLFSVFKSVFRMGEKGHLCERFLAVVKKIESPVVVLIISVI